MAEEKDTEKQTSEETESSSNDEVYSPSEEEKKLVEKWKKRFTRAEEFMRPYRAKHLRMYKLYRAYQERQNYAYETRLMPPIAFEIIETVVSRMATAKRKTRILPREKKDLQSDSLQSWDDLVNYDFDIIKLTVRLRDWVKSSSIYGNGIGMTTWMKSGDYDDPVLDILDLWEILIAPETIDLHEDCPWLIRRIAKTKAKLEKEEEARGEDKIYKNLKFVESKSIDDWKKERYEIDTKKMGQIAVGSDSAEGATIKVGNDKSEKEKQIELWECWDFEECKIVTIANQDTLIRNDDNPYKSVNGGRIFIDLPDHDLPWEFWAIGHIEPVESTIIEIADLRNQRMDDVILMLDPVIKIRKDSGITKDSIVFGPGAKWELRKMDDVVIERPPEISLMGINEEKMLREEIERTLAISEYASGQPKSAQEPLGKVEMLIGQSNMRLGSFAGNIAFALTRLANNLVQLNQEFLTEDKLYRIVGDDVEFKEFKQQDKEVKVDAVVEIEPVVPPDKQMRLNESLMLHDRFVGGDKPDPNDPDAMKAYKTRKRAIEEMILEATDKEAYKTLFFGEEKKMRPQATPEPVATPESTEQPNVEGSAVVRRPSFIRRALNSLPFIGGK
ncbi:MAG: hypothetical protein Q8P17_03600 [bacterium]|nr:hypothetical protein [bacterium]